ncbi:uncharacterized protein [Drosophila pseudoobscura]|uniref:Uncharacterized protein isoform X2 n=1 Tax=Drosophila pseudoobscura pseudoobscura TaxID=46245 RepID=A0A6I8W543_DROPS|nr:uncharacterized protein LOC6896985 isoform X2 [Drosophila pseudoobscura]
MSCHREMFSQAPVLSSQKSKLLSLDEQLIRQLFYKYHTLELSNALDKQSDESKGLSVYGKRLEGGSKRRTSTTSINPKVSQKGSVASVRPNSSFSHHSTAPRRHFESSFRDSSRHNLSATSRLFNMSHCLRPNASATSHISNVSKRLQELAKAKQSPKVLNTRPPWHLTWSMRTFKASDRLTLLAKSRMPSIEKLYNPFSVAQRALTYKATERINLLAVPRKRTPAVVEYSDVQVRSTRKGFRPGHLTLRLYNLAAPKLREDTTIRRKPFTVRRSAMRATLTPRLEQLSQPRQQFIRNWE